METPPRSLGGQTGSSFIPALDRESPVFESPSAYALKPRRRRRSGRRSGSDADSPARGLAPAYGSLHHVSHLESELVRAQKEIERMLGRLQDAGERNLATETKMLEQKERLREESARNNHFAEMIAEAEAENKRLAKRLERMEWRNGDEVRQLSLAIGSMEEECHDLRYERDQMEKELQEERKRWQRIEAQSAKQTDEHAALVAELSSAGTEKQELEAQLSRATDELVKTRAEEEGCEQRILSTDDGIEEIRKEAKLNEIAQGMQIKMMKMQVQAVRKKRREKESEVYEQGEENAAEKRFRTRQKKAMISEIENSEGAPPLPVHPPPAAPALPRRSDSAVLSPRCLLCLCRMCLRKPSDGETFCLPSLVPAAF